MIFYQADWICPASSPPIRNGALAVEGNRIAGIYPEVPDGAERVSYSGCVIVPGFVNAHAHLEITLFQGLLEGLPFPEWLAKLVRLKYQICTPDALKVSAQMGVIDMLRAGITTIGEVMDLGTGWEAMKEYGLRGVAYQEVFGPAEQASAEALQLLQQKVNRHRRAETQTQRIGVSPHAPYSVSRTLYEAVRDYARKEGLLMTAHIAESQDETLFVRDGAGPFAKLHQQRNIDVAPRGCLPVAYLDRLGLLGPDMLLIHVIEADAQDLSRIRDTGTFVVHCPNSNAKLGHRIAPIAEMRELGVPVALGTDGAPSNDAIDMFAEMRAVMSRQRLASDDVFRMATIEGARALGLSAYAGSLEPGKCADFAVVPLRRSSNSPVEDMIRYCRAADVKATFLDGREVALDDRKIRDEVQRLRVELRSRLSPGEVGTARET